MGTSDFGTLDFEVILYFAFNEHGPHVRITLIDLAIIRYVEVT